MQLLSKKLRIVYWCSLVLLSMALGIYIGAAGYEVFRGVGLALLIGWFVIVLLLMLAMNLWGVRRLNRQLEAIHPLLKTDPDEYVRRLDALLGGKEAPALRQVHVINTAVAMLEKKSYDEAERQLLSLDPKKLRGRNAAVYWADLALTRFHQGRPDDASGIFTERERLFTPYRGDDKLGPILASLECCRLLQRNDPEGAREVLLEARSRWPGSDEAALFNEVERYLR